MNNLLPAKNNGKSLFKQPGGTLGMLILAVAIVVGGIFLYRILPYLITLAENILYFGGMLIIGSAIIYLILDPKFRKRVGILYMMLMRWFTSLIITIDPIAIIENAVENMEKSIRKMEENMGKLNGVRLKLRRKIEEKKIDMQTRIQKSKAATNIGKKELSDVELRQATRLENSIKTFMSLLESAEKWYSTLDRLCELAKLTVIDTKNEVENKKEEYETVKQAHKAFKSAMSVLDGDPDELALFNQSLDFMKEDVMNKLGEMDRVISMSGGMLDQLDVEKELISVQGKDIMKRYDEVGMDSIFKKFEVLPSGKQAPCNNQCAKPFVTDVQEIEKKKYF